MKITAFVNRCVPVNPQNHLSCILCIEVKGLFINEIGMFGFGAGRC